MHPRFPSPYGAPPGVQYPSGMGLQAYPPPMPGQQQYMPRGPLPLPGQFMMPPPPMMFHPPPQMMMPFAHPGTTVPPPPHMAMQSLQGTGPPSIPSHSMMVSPMMASHQHPAANQAQVIVGQLLSAVSSLPSSYH